MAEIDHAIRHDLKPYRGFSRKMRDSLTASKSRHPSMYCVYILYSATIEQYYCGQTKNLSVRLVNHNFGNTLSNKHGIPWILIGFINCETRSQAMTLEKKIKKRGIKRWLETNRHEIIPRSPLSTPVTLVKRQDL